MLAIRRLGSALDRAARAGRIKRRLPIYSTEFGYQTNPPDPFVSTSPARQAELLNTMEEYSYRYPRLKSYSQYLLFDDVARVGLLGAPLGRLPDGPAVLQRQGEALFRGLTCSPLVVHKRGRGVSIWGHVRPGTGTRYVQLQRRSGGSFVNDGSRDQDELRRLLHRQARKAGPVPLPGLQRAAEHRRRAWPLAERRWPDEARRRVW